MKRLLLGLFPLLFCSPLLLAQEAGESPVGDDAATAAGALIGGTCGCVILLVSLAIWIFLVVYVYRDSKARGMDNAVLLTVVTAITGVLGLIIYLLMRPKGNLAPCPSCSKKRLEGSVKCPHCGNP
ncbi:hypothetical protein BH20VER2_BH20VER2_10570 [soil metagenome]